MSQPLAAAVQKNKPRVSIACTNCRAQHLRCDAAIPECKRCRSLQKSCVYKDLRRSSRRLSSAKQTVTTTGNGYEAIDTFALQPKELQSIFTYSNERLSITPSQIYQISINSDLATNTGLDSFYSWFFPAHPFTLPRLALISQHEKDPESLQRLLGIMKHIGLLYARDKNAASSRQTCQQTFSEDITPSGFNTQALILFALVLEWSGEGDQAEETLTQAKSMAIRIGLHTRQFAEEVECNDPILQESWRRTWYELYVIDSLFAGIRHLPTYQLWNITADVALPCEEDKYLSLSVPPCHTLEQYDNRGFEDTPLTFSSYTYLIDAARILGTCLAAGDIAGKCPSELVKNAEANILSWDLHLPKDKKDPVTSDGKVDEVLFRAHMMIHTVAIHLHRPRSALHYSTMELLCSQYAPPLPAEVLPPDDRQPDRHTYKAIRAARSFVDLLSVPSPTMTHSPFVMCMGSMAMATHLSACEYLLQGTEFAHAKDRVRVFLGILKAFDGIWPQTTKWSSEVKLMAKAVFEGRNAEGLLLEPSGAMAAQSQFALDSDALLPDGRIEELDSYIQGLTPLNTEDDAFLPDL